MQLGMIGLGRMGANMVRRLMKAGHECVVYDVSPDAVKQLEGEGAAGAATLQEFAQRLAKPRAAWMMVPAGIVDKELADLTQVLERDDIVVDGGNSYYIDDIRRARELRQRGLHYVDVGVSGGVFGLQRGYSLMIGGEDDAIMRLDPIFEALAPGRDAAPATPGRDPSSGTADKGYLHCGPVGAGHFVKM
ncbi:MAG TPA: NAD(P)-binding domain-containing protein, partial [Chloroflexota bacterium]|nr:NAD(P)-binding domain-containing protein [Chloroflexota bacterium]